MVADSFPGFAELHLPLEPVAVFVKANSFVGSAVREDGGKTPARESEEATLELPLPAAVTEEDKVTPRLITNCKISF